MSEIIKLDKTYWSKVQLPNNTNTFTQNHFQQNGLSWQGNIKTPGQMPANFSLHKISLIVSKANDAPAQADLDNIHRIIRGGYIELVVSVRKYLEIPFEYIITEMPMDNQTTTATFKGSLRLNEPVYFRAKEDFVASHTINPFGNDLSSYYVTLIFSGFEYPSSFPKGNRVT